MTATEATDTREPDEVTNLWRHIFGGTRGLLQVWTGKRSEAGAIDKATIVSNYFNFPGAAQTAATWALDKSAEGREVYFCAHLLTEAQRIKDNAAEVISLWGDLDGAPLPNGELKPTAVVESSPGHYHAYWRLECGIPPKTAEQLNKRLADAIEADPSGFDLTQLLRVPGTTNHKYEGRPNVQLHSVDGTRSYSAAALDKLLPDLEEPEAGHEPAADDGDEPPIVLNPHEQQVWEGKDPKLKDDGSIDRSASLLKIGRVLYDAGANRRVIAEALKERDETLGYRKYSGNRDGGRREYERISEKLAKKDRNPRVRVSSGGGGRPEAAKAEWSENSAEEEEPWPEPRALDTALPPVAAFTADMLPEPLGSHVVDAARRMDNVAPEFIAAPMIVGAGTVIGRKVAIRPKARDDWQVICNLWGANVGEPSTMKTPAQAAGLAPVTRLAAEARERFEARSVDHKLDAVEGEIREKHLRDALKKAVKENDPVAISSIRQEMAELSEADAPTEERYKTSDATIEKLGELLRDNPNGLLNDRDELMGWLSTLDRAGHESDRAFFLEAWNGDSPYHVDRIGRGSIHVPALCLSIFGGIQPGPLTTYVRDALSESEKADGLLQRFQVLVWPDRRPYERVDEPPDPNTKEAVFQAFKTLAAFDPKEFGASFDAFGPEDPEQESEPEGVPYVRFTEDAQAVFDGWRDEFEPRIRSGAFPAAVEAHFLKYRSLFASLALVFEVLDHVAHKNEKRTKGAVGEVSAARAAAWCEFLESHAMRLYHPALMAPVMVAEALLERIEAGDVAHKMKTRDIWRKGWQGLATAEDLRRAVDVLEEHGWVRRETVKPAGGGRPSEQLHIHSHLRDES